MTIIISRVINLFSSLCSTLTDTLFHVITLDKFPWRRRCDSHIDSWLVVSAERHEYLGRKAWKVGGATVKLRITACDLIAFIKFRLIPSATVFWSIIELLIAELYNQVRCDRHARQLYGSATAKSGQKFFSPLVFANLWFCVPNFIFLRIWRLWRSVTRIVFYAPTS